jgi:hypothetical protein
MKIRIKIFLLQFMRLMCMDETYFYFSLILPCYFIFFVFPASMFSAMSLIILHYICWKYLMRPAFVIIGNMKTERKDIEKTINTLKIKRNK